MSNWDIDAKLNTVSAIREGGRLFGLSALLSPLKVELGVVQDITFIQRQARMRELFKREELEYDEELKALGKAKWRRPEAEMPKDCAKVNKSSDMDITRYGFMYTPKPNSSAFLTEKISNSFQVFSWNNKRTMW